MLGRLNKKDLDLGPIPVNHAKYILNISPMTIAVICPGFLTKMTYNLEYIQKYTLPCVSVNIHHVISTLEVDDN